MRRGQEAREAVVRKARFGDGRLGHAAIEMMAMATAEA